MLTATGTSLHDRPAPMEPVEEFSNILHDYQDRVYNQAFRMLGNQEDAEEAAQDIFLKIYHSLGNFRGESKLSTWIYRIVTNVCISRLRKRQLDMQSLDSTIGDDNGSTLADFLPSDDMNPEELLESKEAAELIRSKVSELQPDWAMAISLFHFDDLTYDEIAEVMNVPKATIATYIFRGRKQLARKLMNMLSM